MRRSRAFEVVALTLAWTWGAGAQSIPILNFGFEDVALVDGASSGSAPSWGPLGGAGTLNPTAAMYVGGAPEGQNVGFLNGNPSLMSQGFGTLQFGTYTIQVDVGRRLDMAFSSLGISFRSNTTILLASFNSGASPNPGQFVTQTLIFDVLPANVNGGFVGGNANILLLAQGGGQANIDNVRVTFAPVPEPATLLSLICASISAWSWLARRRPSAVPTN